MTPEQQRTVNRYLIDSVMSFDMARFHLCLQKGGDIKMREEGTGRTLLMIAIVRHPGCPSWAQTMIDKGCEILAVDKSGRNAFDIADAISDANWRKKMVETLLKALPDAKPEEPLAAPANDFNAKAPPQATERALPSVKPISFDDDGGDAPQQAGKQFRLG